MSGLLWRDDRGSMDTSSMTGAMFLGLAVIVPCLVFVGPRSGWLVVLVVVGGAVVATSVLAMGVVAAEKYWQRANRRLHDEMDPLLAEWLGKTKVGDDDLRDWRCARRAGITVAEAQRWSDHGMPFPLATSARKFRIDLPTVVALAGVLRTPGCGTAAVVEIYGCGSALTCATTVITTRLLFSIGGSNSLRIRSAVLSSPRWVHRPRGS